MWKHGGPNCKTTSGGAAQTQNDPRVPDLSFNPLFTGHDSLLPNGWTSTSLLNTFLCTCCSTTMHLHHAGQDNSETSREYGYRRNSKILYLPNTRSEGDSTNRLAIPARDPGIILAQQRVAVQTSSSSRANRTVPPCQNTRVPARFIETTNILIKSDSPPIPHGFQR
jgi:hypothetical protein